MKAMGKGTYLFMCFMIDIWGEFNNASALLVSGFTNNE